MAKSSAPLGLKCPRCHYLLENMHGMRCPRCNASLAVPGCGGNCGNCSKYSPILSEGCNVSQSKK